MLSAKINVTLKKTVSDPQGLAVKHALESLDYKGLTDVRIGKFMIIKLDYQDKRKAEEEVDQMCKKLLVNPIIEDYCFTIKEE